MAAGAGVGGRYLVLDTESSLCLRRRRRVLVSLAYEVVDLSPPGVAPPGPPHGGASPTPPAATAAGRGGAGGVATPPAAHYELVLQPPDVAPDARSVAIHGIPPPASWGPGRPLRDVLERLFECLRRTAPCAVVGHDVVGDVHLLVSEAVHAGLGVDAVPPVLGRLVCTRLLATGRCAIPLPAHLRTPFPCDLALRRLNDRRPAGPWDADDDDDDEAATAPPPRYKWPSLEESYRSLGGAAPTPPPRHGPHDARGDVERCRAVFLALRAGGDAGDADDARPSRGR